MVKQFSNGSPIGSGASPTILLLRRHHRMAMPTIAPYMLEFTRQSKYLVTQNKRSMPLEIFFLQVNDLAEVKWKNNERNHYKKKGFTLKVTLTINGHDKSAPCINKPSKKCVKYVTQPTMH